MKRTQVTRQDNNTEQATLYIAFELADREWKLAFGDGSRDRLRKIDADEREEIWAEIEKSIEHFGLGDDVRLVSC